MYCAICGTTVTPGSGSCFRCGAPVPPGEAPGASRITVTDRGLAESVGADVILGQTFAFLRGEAFGKPGLAWMRRLLGGAAAPPRSQVISLLDREPVTLPGATIAAAAFPSLSLAAVTSDKALYREGRDEIHLLALDPLAPGAEVALEIRANGADFGKQVARLDGRGAAAVTLRDLPAGEYEVRFRGAPREAPACSFTVAEYRLAPLVAALVQRKLDGERLSVKLKLESFGAPVDGRVKLELADRGKRIADVVVDASGGICEALFHLTGAGPHAVNVQLLADASRTATVPIVGSRASERSRTIFSTLGAEVTGSLLPSESSRPVRGLFLEDGATRTSPFRLDRVDAARARLVAVAAVDSVRIVVIDPRVPARRPGAIDPTTAPHPAKQDERYRRGEELFNEKKYAEARAEFEVTIAESPSPHPNYAYYVACCFAHAGDVARGVAALRRAIGDGWADFALLARDEDLAALRGDPTYEAIVAGAPHEIAVEDVEPGQVIEIDVPAPMALLAVGAWIGREPWEGWAAVIAPEAVAPKVTVPERAVPGDDATITVETGRAADDATVYVVVKDARLLTPDTPASRLAGGLKAYAEAASKDLGSGRPGKTLAGSLPTPLPPPPVMRVMRSLGAAYGGGMPPPPAPGGFYPPPSSAASRASSELEEEEEEEEDLATMVPMAAPAPQGAAPTGAPRAKGGAGPYREAAPPPPPSVEEPEVLFAGVLSTKGGRASLNLRLGGDFADYIVEAFVIAGGDWAPVTERFRAEREIFVSLELPAFVHPSDAAMGRLHAGSRSGNARVHLTRDGAPVPLVIDGRALAPDEALPAGRAEISFLAGPGEYQARIEDGAAVERIGKRVDAPGKLRRVARGVRFLSPGQSLSREKDPSILALRVLPGLDKPFKALVDATGDYGHACCEQTAAKMLAASAMYALAEDPSRRSRAEAILLAGVRREASMWLRGRGFKMYPESSHEPNEYWGSQAARHLWNLGMLRDLRGDAAPGRTLSAALDEGLHMAEDATRAYSIEWPPRRLSSCQDAYAALRFGGASAQAIDVVRRSTEGAALGKVQGGAVGMRAEAAYGAAALFRAGGAAERGRALSLANSVVEQLGAEGRLYSTVDSAAAIALMVELDAAQVIGAGGMVEIDGVRTPVREAVTRDAAIREVGCVEGVVAVAVDRLVEEDWDTFSAGLPLRVALEKGGGAVRRLSALDSVDLVVRLETGYKPGDLCWVCLPDALSRIVGGGQVKRFSVDFQGKDEIRVSLAATGVTVGKDGKEGPARFAVCVRNMFEEERGGNPGTLDVTVSPPSGGGSLVGRALGALRGLFGG